MDAAERPQVLTNAAISVFETDLLRRGEIESFPGVPLPSGEDLSEAEKLRFLKQNGTEDLMRERAPFFFIERAVAIDNHTVLGLARMTVERSAGHFPAKPIVPLTELCKPMAKPASYWLSFGRRLKKLQLRSGPANLDHWRKSSLRRHRQCGMKAFFSISFVFFVCRIGSPGESGDNLRTDSRTAG